MYKILFHKRTSDDIANLKAAKLDGKARLLIDILRQNPLQNPPPYEKLVGDMEGLYSRRINHKHRLVYKVDQANRTVFVLSLWTHYEY